MTPVPDVNRFVAMATNVQSVTSPDIPASPGGLISVLKSSIERGVVTPLTGSTFSESESTGKGQKISQDQPPPSPSPPPRQALHPSSSTDRAEDYLIRGGGGGGGAVLTKGTSEQQQGTTTEGSVVVTSSVSPEVKVERRGGHEATVEVLQIMRLLISLISVNNNNAQVTPAAKTDAGEEETHF